MTLSNANADLEDKDARFHFHSQTDALRHAAEGPLMIARGYGPRVEDIAGNRYLDGVASLWCASLGFSDARLAAAGTAALETLPVYHTFNHRSNPYVAELAKDVAAIAPMSEARVFFTDGGSEAVDSMVKMAWYYHVARGAPERKKIIARHGAFHGSTVMAARISGLPAMHRSFNLPDCNVVHTGRPHFYRDGLPGESERDFAARLGAELEITDRGRGARDDRRLHRRAGDGGRRRPGAARGLSLDRPRGRETARHSLPVRRDHLRLRPNGTLVRL